MAKKLNIEFSRTYASIDNAEKAIKRVLGDNHQNDPDGLHYSIWPVVNDNNIRYGIVFYGERAVRAGMHYHFNIIG